MTSRVGVTWFFPSTGEGSKWGCGPSEISGGRVTIGSCCDLGGGGVVCTLPSKAVGGAVSVGEE